MTSSEVVPRRSGSIVLKMSLFKSVIPFLRGLIFVDHGRVEPKARDCRRGRLVNNASAFYPFSSFLSKALFDRANLWSDQSRLVCVPEPELRRTFRLNWSMSLPKVYGGLQF